MDTGTVLGELAAAGINAWPESKDSFATDSGRSIAVSARSRQPTPVDIERDLQRAGDGWVLYSVRRLTPGLRAAVQRDARVIAWVEETRSLWLEQQEHRGERTIGPAPRGRRPYVRLAIARSLILDPRPRRQVQLAADLGVPQSAVSHGLSRLGDLVGRTPGGYIASDPGRLWDHVMLQYPGVGGMTTYWWHDAPLEEQARMMGERTAALLSGDLAARRIAPWRQPEHVTLYLEEGVDPSTIGFALASRGDYTLSVTVPDDETIVTTAAVFGSAPGCVDPVIAAYDVLMTGSTGDQAEAADHVRDTVLRGRGRTDRA